MFFSAAQLSKMSAAQICYLRDKPKPPATPGQIKGNLFALEHAKSPMQEMQGHYKRGEIDIWFTIDEYRTLYQRNYSIEHKMATNAELWFFRSAVIQTAFLGALTSFTPRLKTAKWYEGEHFEIESPSNMHSVLNFGGVYYKINFSTEPLMRFFLTKARASLSFSTARRFDAVYKNKEWEHLKDAIRYRRWNRKA